MEHMTRYQNSFIGALGYYTSNGGVAIRVLEEYRKSISSGKVLAKCRVLGEAYYYEKHYEMRHQKHWKNI